MRIHLRRNRPHGLVWQVGSRTGEISSGTTSLREAERAAGKLESQLRQGYIPNKECEVLLTWPDFRVRYEREWLTPMSFGSWQGWRTAANHLEAICAPKYLADVDKATLSSFLAGLEAKGVGAVSARSYYAAVHAALGWAASIDLIEAAPTVRRRRQPERLVRRQRVITAEEFDRLALACETEPLRQFVAALWLTGLRIDELNRLSHDPQAPLRLEKRLIVIHGAQKNKQDSYLPAPPEFWDLVASTGRSAGPAFPVPGDRGRPLSTRTVGRLISAAGRRANIVVNPSTGKCATAHDLRAAWITRLASAHSLSQVQKAARHSDPKTTSKFYVRHEAESLAEAFGW